jgi:hypothetical protein
MGSWCITWLVGWPGDRRDNLVGRIEQVHQREWHFLPQICFYSVSRDHWCSGLFWGLEACYGLYS